MTNNAPMYSTGDIVSPLAQSLVMTFVCTNVNIVKGDVVALSATNLTDGSAPGTVASTSSAGDATAIGIATDSYTTTDATSPRVVPVLMHGIVVGIAAAAIAQGAVVASSATQGQVQTIAAPTTAAILASMLGFAITNFAAGSDQGYLFIIK